MKNVYRWRSLGGMLALVLVMSGIGRAYATITQNLTNPSFGQNTGCTHSGWTTSGWLAAGLEGGQGNCAVNLTAVHDLSVSPTQITASKIEQSFTLSSSDPTIYFYYKSTLGSHSNICGMKLRLYAAGGGLLYEEAIVANLNNNALHATSRSFPAYAGQAVKLSVEAYVLNPQPGVKNIQKLVIDFELTTAPITSKDPDPDGPPGGGL